MRYRLSKFKRYFILPGLLMVLLLSLSLMNRNAIHHDIQEKDSNLKTNDGISNIKEIASNEDVQKRISPFAERDGKTHVVVFKGSDGAEIVHDMAADIDKRDVIEGSAGTLTYFEPVDVEGGPSVDKNIPVKELPYFEPVTNATGPPSDPEMVYRDLPEFIPIESESGPPG